tara:strand:- start:4156 stop:4566 length:411 start_codon:yes stop_codon:yes gene_type:complete
MWYYNDEIFNSTPEDYQGFVYEIVELDTGRKYIGKKNFWKPKTLPITKTRRRRVRTRTESDWKSYFGSSEKVNSLVESKGNEGFRKVILRLCKTKGEMSYFETKLQFDNDVLFNDNYYNEFIGCKIHAKHLGGING